MRYNFSEFFIGLIKVVMKSQVVEQMEQIIRQWESRNDRRAIFLSCYALMTQNMAVAVQSGEFNNPTWVDGLLHHFADYYFNALQAWEKDPAAAPAVWQLAFRATQDMRVQPVQHLLLGVNAHINYDLTFALEDMLCLEWKGLSSAERQDRYADHCHVNQIIAQTVDAVQDGVLERYSPRMDIVDKVMGPIDEWAVVKLISHWRDEVWQSAVGLLEAGQVEQDHRRLAQAIEKSAVQRARMILSL
jgi:hypothetical protein